MILNWKIKHFYAHDKLLISQIRPFLTNESFQCYFVALDGWASLSPVMEGMLNFEGLN